MKILLYIRSFLKPSMTFIYNQIQEIEKYHQIMIVTSNRINKDIFPYQCDLIKSSYDIKEFRNKLLRKLNIIYLESNSLFTKQLNMKINDFNPDIIHIHFGYNLIKTFDNLKNKNIPLLTTFHGKDASANLKKKIYKNKLIRIYKNKNVYGITVSNNIKKRFHESGINTVNFTTDYLGVDTEFFKPSKIDNKYKYFLQVSNFVEKKGHEYTLKAFHIFLNNYRIKGYKLILAGDGPLKKEMIKLSEVLNIQNFVEFPGYVNREQTKKLMNDSSYFIHHSITAKDGDMEGIPTVIMEAMSMNLPVISTYHSGIPELLRDGIDGYLVNEKDIEDYSKKMFDILSFKERSMRERIIYNFNLKKNSTNLLNIYQTILKNYSK